MPVKDKLLIKDRLNYSSLCRNGGSVGTTNNAEITMQLRGNV